MPENGRDWRIKVEERAKKISETLRIPYETILLILPVKVMGDQPLEALTLFVYCQMIALCSLSSFSWVGCSLGLRPT
jgi:hypothetical protein